MCSTSLNPAVSEEVAKGFIFVPQEKLSSNSSQHNSRPLKWGKRALSVAYSARLLVDIKFSKVSSRNDVLMKPLSSTHF